MAQERLGAVPDLDLREAEEIERLLQEEEAKAEKKGRHLFKRFFSRKLVLGLTAVLLAGGAGWAILNVLRSESGPAPEATVKSVPVPAAGISSVPIQKPNVYPLEPFFIPIFHQNRETGKFLHMTVHLVLSNRRLHSDIDKVRPLIRKSIYASLSRKRLKDFEKGGIATEEQIKREILTAANSFLLSGTGTVTNIIFTEFMVNPA